MSSHAIANTGATTRVKGIYAHLDCLLAGIEELKREGFYHFEVLSPTPRHEILEAMYEGRPSPVRWFTLTGAVVGITSGFLLAALTAIQWPMLNPGGKPLVTIPPYVPIMFECTILGGSLFNLIGGIVMCGLPGWFEDPALQDPRASDDKFGIVFTQAPEGELARIQDVLTRSGAIEVTHGDAAIYEVPNV